MVGEQDFSFLKYMLSLFGVLVDLCDELYF